ncbi:MAG: DUF4389 domain-containing protein [Pseudomonadota bacterium]|nr:DUF4389 domain-containing protein [Gammaproteobacteria bacterium]MBU1558531.1 DUF4389 domain-containing protein [Gammaproteobacteria bacterium]MBU1629373.1 DUF4389 domain-containing protein [Gammaproteobacteria bacterium]MBU2545960.1 DUF4389 domain-containing protein [Gammaproteobacteria bacterium]
MDKEIKNRLVSKEPWIRLLLMVVFAFVNYIVQMVVWAIAAVQFILILVLGNPNKNLSHFSDGLCAFSFHILKYLTYIEDTKPYPFTSWPSSKK